MTSKTKINLSYEKQQEESSLTSSSSLMSSSSLLPAKKLFRTFTSNEDCETTVVSHEDVNKEYDLVESLQRHLHHWRQRALEAELRAIRATEDYQLAEMENQALREEMHHLQAIAENSNERELECTEKSEQEDTVAISLLRSLYNVWTLLFDVQYDALARAKLNLWEQTILQLSRWSSKIYETGSHTILPRDNYMSVQQGGSKKEQKLQVIDIDEAQAEESRSNLMQRNVATTLTTVHSACCNLRSWSERCKELLATLNNDSSDDKDGVDNDDYREFL